MPVILALWKAEAGGSLEEFETSLDNSETQFLQRKKKEVGIFTKQTQQLK